VLAVYFDPPSHGVASGAFTEEEQRVVNEERTCHPNPRIREKMLVVWLLHNGVTRRKAAEMVGVGRASVLRYVVAFREGRFMKFNFQRFEDVSLMAAQGITVMQRFVP
jgi:hypothetical protein